MTRDGTAVAISPTSAERQRGRPPARIEIKGIHMAPAKVAVATMTVAQIPKPHGGFQIVERGIPEPGRGQVRIKVRACGVCGSDVFTMEGSWPGIDYPLVPGHEVAGVIDELGADVSRWTKGQRVGVGWHGG